jgi:ATPase
MDSSDLSRPVIQVFDFGTKDVVYEIYSFWEQIVVMPLEDVQESKWQSGLAKHALGSIKRELAAQFRFDFLVQIKWNSLTLYVPAKMKPRVIWSWGANIQSLEKSLSMSISVRLFSDLPLLEVQADQEINGKWSHMILAFPPEMASRDVALLIEDTILQTRIDNWATIHISGKWKVNAMRRHWFVVVDMSHLA